MKPHCLQLIFIYLIPFLSTGCEIFITVPVDVRLPEPPAEFPEISGWVIEYPSEIKSGSPVYSQFPVAPGIASATIPVARGVNLPVIAFPVLGNSNSPESLLSAGRYPAGGVFPADMESGVMNLKWASGFACEIFRSCLYNSDMLRGFDTKAFRAAAEERSALFTDDDKKPLPGGVWLIDPEPIISRLGYGLFRESSIRAAETMVFRVPVRNSEGLFVSDNPFYSPVRPDPEGLLEITVPVNRKTIFMNTDSGEAFELFFSDKLWCWTNLVTGASESGRM